MLQPDLNMAMGLLTHLNSDELKEMLNDDTKFDSVLKDVKQVKDWETEREMIIASNRSLAEFNLAKEPEITRLKEEINEKSALGEELSKRIQELLEEYKTKSEGVSPDTTLALLETAAREIEEESEAIADKLLSGELEIENFLEEFSSIRKLMHLRKFKADKMKELIRNGNRFSSYDNGVPRSNLPYPNYYPQGPQSVPYPMGPMNMPMPNIYGNHF